MPGAAVVPAAHVSAVIPTLADDPARLAATIESVRGSVGEARVEIRVIVNAAETRRVDYGDDVDVVLAGVNLGWSGALAFARTLTTADHLWLIQDDLVVAPDTLGLLLAALEADPRLGAVSPADVHDGVVRAGTRGGRFRPDGLRADPEPLTDVPFDSIADDDSLDFVPSRALLVRTTAWDEAGGMDPRYYPLQWADVDLCFALRAAGHRIRAVGAATIEHRGSVSTGSFLKEFLLARNHELFAAKWAPGPVPALRHSTLRPNRAARLNGVVDPRIPRELLATVAQSAGDAFLHLARVSSASERAWKAGVKSA